jgi:hypothetical protein
MGSSFSTKCSGFYRDEYGRDRDCRYTHNSSDRSRYEDGAVDWDDLALLVLGRQEIFRFTQLFPELCLVVSVLGEVQFLVE